MGLPLGLGRLGLSAGEGTKECPGGGAGAGCLMRFTLPRRWGVGYQAGKEGQRGSFCELWVSFRCVTGRHREGVFCDVGAHSGSLKVL